MFLTDCNEIWNRSEYIIERDVEYLFFNSQVSKRVTDNSRMLNKVILTITFKAGSACALTLKTYNL